MVEFKIERLGANSPPGANESFLAHLVEINFPSNIRTHVYSFGFNIKALAGTSFVGSTAGAALNQSQLDHQTAIGPSFFSTNPAPPATGVGGGTIALFLQQGFKQSPANVLSNFALNPASFGEKDTLLTLGTIAATFYTGAAPQSPTAADFYLRMTWEFDFVGTPPAPTSKFPNLPPLLNSVSRIFNGQGTINDPTNPAHVTLPFIAGASSLIPNPQADTFTLILPLQGYWTEG